MSCCVNALNSSQQVRVENCSHVKTSIYDKLIHAMEKISALALGIFSAYVNMQLFAPFFWVGVGIGVLGYMHDAKSDGHKHAASSCAHGLIEQLTGVKLPRVVSLMANIAATVCHIDHHATVFVPIVGVSLGAWVGQNTAHYGILLQKRLNFYPSKLFLA